MNDDKPLIIELAINGPKRAIRNPRVPLSSDEIAADGLASVAAGAAIIHSQIAQGDLVGQDAVSAYAASWETIAHERPDAILCCTIGPGASAAEKFGHYEGLAQTGLMRMAPWDPGSVNLAASDMRGMPCEPSFIYANSRLEIEICADILRSCGLGPSIAVFEPGFLRCVLAFHQAGRLPPGALIKLYFSGDFNFLTNEPGFACFGLPPTEAALNAYLEMMAGCDLPWAASVLGGDVYACGMARLAIARGGHIRVGLEDFGGTPTPSNAELVSQVVALAREMGRPVATPAQAAELLRLRPAGEERHAS